MEQKKLERIEKISELSDSERVDYLEIEDIRNNIVELNNAFIAKKNVFFGNLQIRLKEFKFPIEIDNKTGDIYKCRVVDS